MGEGAKRGKVFANGKVRMRTRAQKKNTEASAAARRGSVRDERRRRRTQKKNTEANVAARRGSVR
jgi:hypothetical protein